MNITKNSFVLKFFVCGLPWPQTGTARAKLLPIIIYITIGAQI